jgi:hypothetical protein
MRTAAIGLALLLSGGPLSAAAQSSAGTDPSWTSKCQADRCVFTDVVYDADTPSQVDLLISVAVDRSNGKITQVSLDLPRYVPGASIAMSFAQIRGDGAGGLRMDTLVDSMRSIRTQDCGAQGCRVLLPAGLLAAQDDRPAEDVGAQMLVRDLMLFAYVKKGDAYETSVALAGFQNAYHASFSTGG